jgi:hypothetical protein
MNENEAKVCACDCKPNGKLRQFCNHIKGLIRDIFRIRRKSNMQSWAEREIDIACKKERDASGVEKGWDYGCACYGSALKAYKSLMGDGHSGFSIGMTQHILNRLIDGKPLTPIEDTPDIWSDISEYRPEEGYRDYQCKRMSSLFKYVYDDGRIKYKDISSFYCIDKTNGSTYHSGLVQRLMDEMFPISLPYMPTDIPVKVYCQDYLTDRKNGDFDTVAIFYAIKPNGDRIDINRFFKEAETDTGWAEIDHEEFVKRQDMELQRLYQETPEFMKKTFHIPEEPHMTCSGCVFDEQNCTNPAPCNKSAQYGYSAYTPMPEVTP